MKIFRFLLVLVLGSAVVRADQINLAEDDASQEAYKSGFESGKNGGSGFGPWKMATGGNDANRHAGFFIATNEHNKDLTGIAQNGKAWGLYANGTGFEQAVAFRALTTPLAVGDSFSFMLETGPFEKKSEGDEGGGAAGLTLRPSHVASDAPGDYNKDTVFEFGHDEGQPNYQVHDGSDKADTGVVFSDTGVIVTVTVTGADSYDLEIQNISDKRLRKLPGRKFKAAGPIGGLVIFNRNSEKNDVFFNGLQVARENP